MKSDSKKLSSSSSKKNGSDSGRLSSVESVAFESSGSSEEPKGFQEELSKSLNPEVKEKLRHYQKIYGFSENLLLVNLFGILLVSLSKLGCVVRMVVDSILLHAESGPNDHQKDAPLFI